jgi:predicted permease
MIFDSLGQDVRYGFRQLRRSPGFTAVALLTLTLGIGGTVALFSLLDAAMFKRLPLPNPEQLVSVIVTTPGGGWMSNVPSALFQELRREPRSFSGVLAFYQGRATIRWDADSERALVLHVSGEYYATLGVSPFLGRLLGPADDTTDGGGVAILGYDFWVRRFGSDPAVLGQTVVVGGVPRTIVGVTPRHFFGTDRSASPDVTVPLGDPRALANVWLMGRLREEASAEQGRIEAQLAWQRAQEILRPTYSRLRRSQREELLARGVALIPGDRQGGRMGMRAHVERLGVLSLLSAVVLLIACANLANLLLARGASRVTEIGTRLAIGAGRARVVRQLLVEGLLLSGLGAVLGLAFAHLAHRVLVVFLIGEVVPAGVAFTLDLRLLLFTAALACATGLLFGLLPALRASRVELVHALRRDARVASLRAGRALVVGQVALCVVLLAAGALLARTLANLRAIDGGFSVENLLLVNLGASDRERSGPAVAAFYEELMARVTAIPGVMSASLGANALFGSGGWTKSVWVQGRPSEEVQAAAFNAVAPGFFATSGMPLVAGRDFSTADRMDTARVAVVNEAFARRYCPSGVPIGCRFRDARPDASGRFEVVGVVKDARHDSLREPPEPTIYEALLQEDRPSSVTLHVRAHGNPAVLAPRVRDEVRQVDSSVPVYGIRTIAQQMEASLLQDRMMATLSGWFALLALFLTCVGLFGTVAYGIERRLREIGIRLALGATRAHVFRAVLGGTLALVGLGATIGVAAALASTRVLENMLFGLSATDPLMLASSVAALLAVGAIACYVPARRALALDPMVVLRRD